MLVLSRKLGQVIVVPQCELSVTVVAVEGKKVRLGISAPEEIDVYREELWSRICESPDERSTPIAKRHVDHDTSIDKFAAELTSAAYSVVIRHGLGHKWLDLQLALWKALTDEIKKTDRIEREVVATPGELPKISTYFG